jgi:hypothetical protein
MISMVQNNCLHGIRGGAFCSHGDRDTQTTRTSKAGAQIGVFSAKWHQAITLTRKAEAPPPALDCTKPVYRVCA